MDEVDREDLTYLMTKIIDSEFEESDWGRVERALALLDQSRGSGDEDWTQGRNELYRLLERYQRTRRGLRDSLSEKTEKPAPQLIREHAVQLLHKVGHVPRQERRADDSA
ncbi:hypothetical protein [Micromonospora sp. WMMD964]|uniref:hypothetical protein n=1 Tax=Micromonospora sp. WMMD964 TaxID=3016091 RepID=UPI00249A3AAA|nr:hypothetical protein [Micromonospora sp. WMMD964]WFF00343.1 hypothetical protein O7616_26200 [Micromonospora sp. WMMD964]